jgi:hypothetical protein
MATTVFVCLDPRARRAYVVRNMERDRSLVCEVGIEVSEPLERLR